MCCSKALVKFEPNSCSHVKDFQKISFKYFRASSSSTCASDIFLFNESMRHDCWYVERSFPRSVN